MARHVVVLGGEASGAGPERSVAEHGAPSAAAAAPAEQCPEPASTRAIEPVWSAPPLRVPSTPGPGPAPSSMGTTRRRSRRRRRVPWPIPVLAVGSMSAVLWLQVTRPMPQPRLTLTTTGVFSVPGTAPVLPWPAVGQGAVAVPSAGVLVSSAGETPVPVASLTKVMTAYLVLEDHPLAPTASGPSIVMTAADVQDDAADEAANDTSIPLTAGQSFTERQLLDGLLVHSANDFADALAQWDAGSAAAFVAKMNATAASMGMSATHYVDPSGIDPSDTSTAADQLRLAERAMSIPTFAAVVAQPSITLPGDGSLINYVPDVGTDGVVGVKSGFTQQAMGCVVLAADREVTGRQVLVLSAVTGQPGPDPLGAADSSALSLIDAATGGLGFVTLVSSGSREATVFAPWSERRVMANTASAVTVLSWPGTQWSYTFSPRAPHGAVEAGETVAVLTVGDGSRRFEVPVRTVAALPSPPMSWRLLH
jgi:serine-type D-Ala-D-Ala carboxypeptidase (penicillin-binding protein 5/6)